MEYDKNKLFVISKNNILLENEYWKKEEFKEIYIADKVKDKTIKIIVNDNNENIYINKIWYFLPDENKIVFMNWWSIEFFNNKLIYKIILLIKNIKKV